MMMIYVYVSLRHECFERIFAFQLIRAAINGCPDHHNDSDNDKFFFQTPFFYQIFKMLQIQVSLKR